MQTVSLVQDKPSPAPSMERKELLLQQLFEEQADRRPDATALVTDTNELSYRELEECANQLAHYLQSQGVQAGDLIGLYCSRSESSIIAILGILKTGAGYVPIDPSFPEDRIHHILEDAKVKVVLTLDSLCSGIENWTAGNTILLDDSSTKAEVAAQPRSRVRAKCREDHLCYVIYTSGTTGKPKGVMTEHRNTVLFVKAFNEVCRVRENDRIFHGFSLGFDGSTALSMISEDLETVRVLIVSGEQCPPELVSKWATGGRRMLNVYGPTEATVNTTVAECFPDQPITIGKPLRGYDLHLLDENQKPVSKGCAGELYVGGETLARGYLNQPEVTAKAFMEVILGQNGSACSSRLYRTGDLVQLDHKGDLLFLGRIDTQVKIRGYPCSP